MIYNVLSSAQYNEAEAQGLINSDELYLLTDDENIFIAEYDVTTWSEVNAAVQDGKAVIATSGTSGEILPLVGTTPDDYFIFRGIGTAGNIAEFELDDTDDWTNSGGSTLATLVSPTFSGTPKAPTAAAGTNTTQIATTAFVSSAITNDTIHVTKAYAAGTAASYEVRYAKFLIDNSTNSSAVPDAANKIIWFYE